MLYKSYEQKIKRISKIIEKIYKFRLLILSIIGVILALVTTYLSIKGVFIEQITFAKQTITYGEQIDYGARSIFSDVSYEFRAEGSETWVKNAPITVGEHSIRAVSISAFGNERYSKEAKFIIEPKQTEITVKESSVVYGAEPNASVDLLYQDKLIEKGFVQSSINVGKVDFSVDLSKVKVVNVDGVDVTNCYSFNAPTKSVNITKNTVQLTTGSDGKIYDGITLENQTFESSKLSYGDQFHLTFNSSITDVGEVDNQAEYKILASDGTDVTENYSVKTTWGKLKVDKRAVTFKADDVVQTYDGNAHSSVKASIVEGELADGHFADEFIITGEMTEVGSPTEATLTAMKIFMPVENDNIDVSHNYQITYQSGSIEILQRKVKVESVKSKIYDHTPLETTDYSLSTDSENAVVLGQTLTLKSNDVIANDIENNPVYAGNKIVYSVDFGGVDVTKNYVIDCSEVSFTIDKRPITVTAGSGNREYNGEPYSLNEFTYTLFASGIGLINGQKIEVAISGSVEDVMPDGNGGYLTTENKILSVVIKPENSNDVHKTVTTSYDVTNVNGAIFVTPCLVDVTFSAMKDYDDTDVLERNEISYTATRTGGEGFFKDHYLNYDYEKASGKTEVFGSPYVFTVSNVAVLSPNVNESVAKNYDISCDGNGLLTIKPIPLKVETTSPKSKEYDRIKLIAPDPEVEGLLSNHKIKILGKAYQLIVGDKPAEIDYEIRRNDESVIDKFNYTIDEIWGTLSITKRKVIIEIPLTEKDYDGYTATILNDEPYVEKGRFLDYDDYVLSTAPYSIKGADGKVYSQTTMINAQTYTVTGSADVQYGSWTGCPTELIGYTGYYDVKVTGEVIVYKAQINVKTQTVRKVVEYDEQGNIIPISSSEWWILKSKLEWNGSNFNDAFSTSLVLVLDGIQEEIGSSYNTVSAIVLGGTQYDLYSGQTSVQTENFIINITYGELILTDE